MKRETCLAPESIVQAIGDDPGLAAYKGRRLSDDVVEARSGAASVLFVWPKVWSTPGALQTLLQQHAHEVCQIVLLGREDEFEKLSVEVSSVRALCWALPLGATRLRTNLKTLFSVLTERHLAADQQSLVARYRYELDELVGIARALSSEQEIDRLLELILEKSRYVTGADAGSVYVLEEGEDGEPRLRFKITQNDSVKMDFTEFTMEVSKRSIVGNAVLKATSINIPDLYSPPEENPWRASHDRSFDERMGYESHSMLTVPMIDHRAEVIGVIQLINRKRDPRRKLGSAQDFKKEVVPFDQRSEELAVSLASLAGISLENALLYNEVRQLFEGLVGASVAAIESRDPTTSGHSLRVAKLTCALAEAVGECDEGPFSEVSFTREAIKELEYACLLHDFGKVGVRERILVKANKLYPQEMDVIRWRFDAIKRALETDSLKQRVEVLEKALEGAPEERKGLEKALSEIQRKGQERLAVMDGFLEVVEVANRPRVLAGEASAALEKIAKESYEDTKGDVHPYLNPEELDSLKIPRGSLTLQERKEIESHVEHSLSFLSRIPWGKNLHRVPEIASKHHEKLDGTGYPAGVRAEEIPIESRMMALADIFDALTASDRPYKKAMPPERALKIIREETDSGKLDRTLCDLFIQKGVYEIVLPGCAEFGAEETRQNG